MKVNLFIIIGVPLLLIIGILAYLTFPWLAIYLGIKSESNPLRPEIIFGEFPFRLEYAINGKPMVIEDTLICEYDGIGFDEGRGKYRKWKQKLASGNERVTLLKVDNTKEIYYTPGSAEYYMGDLGSNKNYEHNFPNAVILEKNGRINSNALIPADQLYKQYKIKLISWDYTQPINNNFVN